MIIFAETETGAVAADGRHKAGNDGGGRSINRCRYIRAGQFSVDNLCPDNFLQNPERRVILFSNGRKGRRLGQGRPARREKDITFQERVTRERFFLLESPITH